MANIPGTQKNAKNAASIARKQNIRALAGKQGVNQGTVSQIATKEVQTAGQGAVDQQKEQLKLISDAADTQTQRQQISIDKSIAGTTADLSKERDEFARSIGSLNRDSTNKIQEGKRTFALSEGRRKWGKNDTKRKALFASVKDKAEFERNKTAMLEGYDKVNKEMSRQAQKQLVQLKRDLKTSEAKKDRESTSRIMAKIAALERAEARRKKNNALNKQILGGAMAVTGAVLTFASLGGGAPVGVPLMTAGVAMAADGTNENEGKVGA